MPAAPSECTMHQSSPIIVVLVLWLAGLGAAAQFAKIGLVLPELADMYPSAGSSLGFLVSSISFVGALLGLFAGSLAARIGLRQLLLAGLVLGAAMSLFQSIGLPIFVLLVSRVLEGVAHLAIVVAAPTLIALTSSKQMRAAAMTLWGSFFGVSYALTAWLGLPLVAHYGVNTLFFVHAILMAAAAVLVVLCVPEGKLANVEDSRQPLQLATVIRQHRQAWCSPYVAAPAAGWLFYTLTFVALLTILPGMMPPEDRSFTATVLPLASILSSLSLGVLLLQWLSAVTVIQISLVTSIVTAVILVWIPETPWPAIALFAALGLMQGATFAAVPQLNPSTRHQALANGTLAQAGNIGNAIGTPVVLVLLAVGDLKAVIAMVVFCYIAAIVAHAELARRREP